MMAIGGSCAITTPGPMGERSAENEILRPSRVCWGFAAGDAPVGPAMKARSPNSRVGYRIYFSRRGLILLMMDRKIEIDGREKKKARRVSFLLPM
jgi:hypothetical protein